jgi:small subunit ribosomal protein S6
MVQHYELLYIIPGTKGEDEVQPLATAVHDLLKQHGATIVKNDFWGKRKLAYEINHIRYGYYEAIDFDIDTLKLAAFESAMRLNPNVLRHQVVIRKVLTAEQQAAATQLHERIAAKREAAKEKEAAAMIKTEAPAPVEAPATPAEPMTTKQLDEKLEEILDSEKVEL